jgi:hypothetical protein
MWRKAMTDEAAPNITSSIAADSQEAVFQVAFMKSRPSFDASRQVSGFAVRVLTSQRQARAVRQNSDESGHRQFVGAHSELTLTANRNLVRPRTGTRILLETDKADTQNERH